MLTREDRVILTTTDKEEAEMMEISLASAVVELEKQTEWGVYTKPFKVPGRVCWMYAVCVGRY